MKPGYEPQERFGRASLPYHGAVAYDERLADRIRALVADEPGLTEKKMFGGLAFLIGGNMAVAASGNGGSTRVASTNCTWGGRCSSRNVRAAWIAGSVMTW